MFSLVCLLVSAPPLPRQCNPTPSHSHPSTPHVQTISACFVSPPLLSPLTPILSLTFTLVILSLRDTPHIILIILISALSSFASCSALIGHVSLPYIIQLRTQLLQTFPFSNSEAPFLVSIDDSSLNVTVT